MLELPAKYPTPAALRRAGKSRVETLLRKHAPRAWKRRVPALFEALAHQARSLAHNRAAQADVLALIHALTQAHPLHELLASMPGGATKTAARILRNSPHPGTWPPTLDSRR